MPIKEGDKIPDFTFKTQKDGKPVDITTDHVFKGKKVVVFGVPGAFTFTCSSEHLPGFAKLEPQFKSKGVDSVVCISVNDSFVMDAWAKQYHADNVLMLADGNADFTKMIGMDIDGKDKGLGIRSRRYSMIVQDKVVKSIALDEGFVGLKNASAERTLSTLMEIAG